MKIALINNLYSKQQRGGAEIVIEKIKTALEEKGHNCFVVSTASNKYIKQKSNRLEKNQNYLIASWYYNLSKLPFLIKIVWHIYKQFENFSNQKIKKILKQEKPDLIISHNLIGFSAKIYKTINQLGIYHVHYLHDTQMLHPGGRIIYKKEGVINSPLAKLYQKIQKRYSKNLDLVVSPSQWLLKLHQKKDFFQNVNTWQKFNPIEKINMKEKRNNNYFTFIYIGQIDRDKGVELMIKAFLKIKAKQNNIQLKIIGSGRDLFYLQNKYQDESINFTGQLSYEKSMTELQKVNTLVLPSLIYENSPTALFDALKLNKDIIASRLGGSIEIVDKYYGQLFTPNNLNSLAQAMLRSIENKAETKNIDLSDLKPQTYIEELFRKLHLS